MIQSEIEDHLIKIKNHLTNKDETAYYRRLTIDDLELLIDIETKNQEFTNSKDMCVDVTREEFKTYLCPGKGIYYGAFIEETLIAMYCMIRPILEENNGIHMGLSDEGLSRVAHWELAHVLPRYRGNGLQKFLSEQCFGCLLKEWTDVEHTFATIYPYNIPSLKSTIRYDFVIIGINNKYGGHLRYILYKPIHGKCAYIKDEFVEIPLDEREEQLKLFEKGYIGTKFIERDDEKYIRFNKSIE